MKKLGADQAVLGCGSKASLLLFYYYAPSTFMKCNVHSTRLKDELGEQTGEGEKLWVSACAHTRVHAKYIFNS